MQMIDEMYAAAKMAVSRVHLPPGACREVDLQDVALSAIGLAIAEFPDIDFKDAVYAGQREIWDTAAKVREDSGMNSQGEEKPHFWKFWEACTYSVFSPPHGIEIRMALAQVFEALPERHQTTLLAFAYADTTEEAADVCYCSPATFRQRLRVARQAALALWFDREEPPKLDRLPMNRKQPVEFCRHGHEMTGDNVIYETSQGRRRARCGTCRLEQKRRYVAKWNGQHHEI